VRVELARRIVDAVAQDLLELKFGVRHDDVTPGIKELQPVAPILCKGPSLKVERGACLQPGRTNQLLENPLRLSLRESAVFHGCSHIAILAA
jgi:hypothetical protein